MGIFNRKHERNSFDFDDSHFNTPETGISQPQVSPAATAAPKRRNSYTIEDATKLMRDLPKDQRHMVVSIVQKTLSSANINVTDIIEDAGRKLSRLDSRSKQLHKEIEELEAGIAQRRHEVQVISQESQETLVVKSSFEDVLEKKTSSSHLTEPIPPVPEMLSQPSKTTASRSDSNSKKPPVSPIAS